MTGLAKILEFTLAPDATAPARLWPEEATFRPARLIAGSASHSVTDRKWILPGPAANSVLGLRNVGARVLPEFFRSLHPSKLGTALCDLAIVITVLLALQRYDGPAVAVSGSYIVLFFASAAHGGLYRTGNQALRDEFLAFAKALIWSATLTCLATGSLRSAVPATLMFVTVACICLLTLIRLLCGTLHIGSDPSRNVLVVGESAIAQKAVDAIHRDAYSGLCVKGFLPQQASCDAFGVQMLKTVARQECIDEVIVATRDLAQVQHIVKQARRNQLSAKIVLDLPSFLAGSLGRVGDLTFLQAYEQPLPQWQLAFKRICDLTLAIGTLTITSPLLVLLAVAIKLDSPGPVLYQSTRIGHGGRRFTCYKFRTMRQNADTEKQHLRALNERCGAFFKIAKDPRVTRIGSFLRRYSLDELPQLCNVIRGEMSLVGPRPHPPDDVQGYSDEHLQRLDFIPGMTGLWQVTARQDPSFERCVALDVEYIKRWSPALDVRILCKTVKAVLQGSGA